MKKIVLALCLSIIVLMSCNKDTDDNTFIPLPDYKSELQTLVNEQWSKFVGEKEDYPGGYALKVISPVGDYYVATGDLSETTENTHFRAASTTKTFTAAAILLLHQQHKLNIEDFVTDTIPGKNVPYLENSENFDIPFKEKISLKLLLQHRAGMYDIINQNIPDTVQEPYANHRYCEYIKSTQGNDHTFTIEETAGIVAKHKLYNSEPGTEFYYSDTGMGLLGLIVERVSGKSYDQFLHDNFLAPLEMNNTTFPYLGTDVSIPEPMARSYAYADGIAYDVTEDNVSMHVAEGNVITTPHDLAIWMNSLYTGKSTIDYENVRFYMMDCLPTFEAHQNYGLGTVYTPELGFGHNGGHIAYFTVARYNPDTDITVVMYTNVWDFEIFEIDFMIEILNMYAVLYELNDVISDN